MMNRLVSYMSVLFATLSVLLTPLLGYAQEIPLSGSFVVRPARAEVTIAPGSDANVDLRLANGTPTPLRVEISFEDVAAEVQTSPTEQSVRLLGSASGPDSLKELLSASRSSFDLLSGKEVIVPIHISIPANALPGGRYGSVVFTFHSLTPTESSGNVALESRVATLFYVRIPGVVKEEGALAEFGLFNGDQFVSSPSVDQPIRFQVAFQNTGDVYLNPHGTISVKGLWGGVQQILIDPFAVLPGATRMREVDLSDDLSFGYYSASLELARGYGDHIDMRTVHFVILPTPIVGIMIIIFVILTTFLIRRSLRISRSAIR